MCLKTCSYSPALPVRRTHSTCARYTTISCVYDFMRASDEPTAERAIYDIKKAGVIVREDMDTEFWKQAGRYKAIHNISIADAVALSLVNRLDAELVTSDHEFDSLADTGEFTIRFFRE